MAEVTIASAERLQGTLRVPGDKSIAHRALFCGALARGWTRIAGVPRSADVSATIRALNVCGVQTQRNDDAVIVLGGQGQWNASGQTIDCANSGTTIRMLMGVLAGQPGRIRLVGDASLSRRPMHRIAEPLEQMGANVCLGPGGFAPLEIGGSNRLCAIDYELPIASAQLKSALLFAGLHAKGTTRLRGRLHSRDHTERMLPQFGVRVASSPDEISIDGDQRLHGIFIEVPGDPSSAAFWIAAAAILPRSEIELRDVCLNPTRVGFMEVLRAMGARIEVHLRRTQPEPVGTILASASSLRGITLGEDEVPALIDELPILAAVATQAHGTTIVRGASELRVKESDRIEAIAAALRSMGAQIETFEDGFAIEGPQPLRGTAIDSRGDHRIAMAASVAALIAHGETRILDAQCVGVSYPGFFSSLRGLGGEVR